METPARDPEALRRRGIIHKLLGGMNLRFPGLFALLAAVFFVDLVVPDFVPFVDEIILAILTMLFALWKERRPPIVTRTTDVPPLPPSGQPPLPPAPGEER
jgi:hypothetical protein